ncbi:hypothetical protein HT031_004993 [Scenedesmus sp. PABB004]|nr:hypothetical protein HT031_004993 [Scenedesmus sp. PABB004]
MGAADGATSVAALQARFAALDARLGGAEAAAALSARWRAIEQRVAAAERALAAAAPAQREGVQQGQQHEGQQGGGGAAAGAAAATAAAAAAAAARDAALAAALVDASPIQARLARELHEKGFSDFRFVRVPPDYYDRPLAWRRDVLRAASEAHLCKSIIMENTRAHSSVRGWEDPTNSKYYVVIVQYTARLNADKLKSHIHRLAGGKVGKQYFNMRLCPEDVSDALSGYEHNAVSPIGIKTPLPVVLSHRIPALRPDFFFIGAGETDLKVGLSAAEFVDRYRPFVLDCTH